MITLFIITFFIAELIIFGAIILKIYGFNKHINSFNSQVLFIKNNASDAFFDLRVFLRAVNISIIRVARVIREKRDEYIFSVFKNAIIYSGAFFLKGRWANLGRLIAAYNIGKEIFEEIKEA